jgi:FSR family fosmidomycin resistance protein-like MFS transporter
MRSFVIMKKSIFISSISASVFSLWLCHFLIDFMIGVWPVFKTMAELDLAIAGIINGACVFLGEGMQIFFGPLSDQGYRKALIVLGVVIATATCLMSYTTSYFIIFLLYLLTCIGSGAFHPSAVGLVGSLSENRKGTLITLFATGGAVGLAASQLIYYQTYQAIGGHTILLIIPSLLVALFIFFQGMKERISLPHEKPPAISEMFQFFKDRNLSCLYIAQLCNQTILWGTMFLLPDILVSRGHEDWICFGGGHLCFFLSGGLMMIPAGYLADRFSAKKVIIVVSILSLIFLYAFLWIPTLPTLFLLVILFLFGAVLGVFNPVALSLGSQLMPNRPGMVSSFLMGMVWIIAEFVGPGGGGLLSKLFTEDAPAKALGLLGIFLLVGAVASFRLPYILAKGNQREGQTIARVE